jgi:hypothetical protein
MSADPLFPLPSSDFLFVYRLTRYRPDVSSPEGDEEGWVERDITIEQKDEDIPCYVAATDRRDVGAFEIRGSVFLVHRDFEVRNRDLFVLEPQPGLAPTLEGAWLIEEVRPNPAHTRVLCTRATVPTQINT